jgi:hypothetical protein
VGGCTRRSILTTETSPRSPDTCRPGPPGQLRVPFIGIAESYALQAFRRARVPLLRVRPALARVVPTLLVNAIRGARRLHAMHCGGDCVGTKVLECGVSGGKCAGSTRRRWAGASGGARGRRRRWRSSRRSSPPSPSPSSRSGRVRACPPGPPAGRPRGQRPGRLRPCSPRSRRPRT